MGAKHGLQGDQPVEVFVTCLTENEDTDIVCPPPPAPSAPSVVVFVSGASASQATIAISNSIAVGGFQFTFGAQTLPSGSFQGFNLTQAQVTPSALIDPAETPFVLESSSPTGVIFAFSSVPGQGIAPGEEQLILTIQLTGDDASQDGAFCIEARLCHYHWGSFRQRGEQPSYLFLLFLLLLLLLLRCSCGRTLFSAMPMAFPYRWCLCNASKCFRCHRRRRLPKPSFR